MQTKTAAKKRQTLEAGSDCLVSAAEAGGPADTGTNKMAAVCSRPLRARCRQTNDRKPRSAQANRVPSITESRGRRFPQGGSGRAGASAHGSAAQQWLLPRQGCRTAVIREQEGGVGAAVPEAVTPAPAHAAARAARRRGRKEAEISEKKWE